jgi:hypothetical protein
VLGLIPILILIGGAVGVAVLHFVPRGMGFAWLLSVITSLAAWIVFLVSKNYLPMMYSTEVLSDIAINLKLPAFQIDLIIWPMVLSILAIVNGTLISSASHIGLDADSREWASVLLLGVIGISACVSQNVITALVLISLFDMADLVITLYSAKHEKANFTFLFWRIASLILFFAVYSWNGLDSRNTNDWETLQPVPAQIALIACIIRFGLSPVIGITGHPRRTSKGLETARLIIGFIITSSIIIQLPVFSSSIAGKISILSYLLLSILVSIARLIKGPPEAEAKCWQIIGGALICAEYIYGYSASAIMFLTAFVPVMFIILQPFKKGRFFIVVGIIGILGFSGVPFTPNNSGLNGFGLAGQIPGIFFVILLIPIFYQMIKSIFFYTTDTNPNIEQWASGMAPIGALLVIISSWFIFFLWQPNSRAFSLSIQSIIMVIGGIGVFLGEKFHLFDIKPVTLKVRGFLASRREKIRLPENMNFSKSVDFVERPILFITQLFEGDGGILWAVLSLALIVTIISELGLS